MTSRSTTSPPPFRSVFGIETEYGIHAPTAPEVHPSVLSAAVVGAYPGVATGSQLDWVEPIPIEDAHNRVLANGARLYVDHAHPEYSGPEVTAAADAVAYDLAGDAAVVAGAKAASAQLGFDIAIYKNNTDSHGASYGCHENHLLPRSVPWTRIASVLPAFLVSRTVLIGAGRVGLGQHGERAGFQLSQRADFFETLEGIQTTKRRPILNTRDEPHAPPSRYRRLHVITADANRNQFATWLKVGSLANLLAALVHDAVPVITLTHPVAAFQAISHDPSLTQAVETSQGRMTALDLQEALLTAVLTHAERAPEMHEASVLAGWTQTLADLRTDPSSCADRLDWVAKYELMRAFADRHDLSWEDLRLAALDLAWARLDAPGPFDALTRAGHQRAVVSPADVAGASASPPADTRAWLRGTLVGRIPDRVLAASWDSMTVLDAHGSRRHLNLAEPLRHTRAEVGEPTDAATVSALLRQLG